MEWSKVEWNLQRKPPLDDRNVTGAVGTPFAFELSTSLVGHLWNFNRPRRFSGQPNSARLQYGPMIRNLGVHIRSRKLLIAAKNRGESLMSSREVNQGNGNHTWIRSLDPFGPSILHNLTLNNGLQLHSPLERDLLMSRPVFFYVCSG